MLLDFIIILLHRLKFKIIKRLQTRLLKMSQSRPPDFTVGQRYLKRWYIIPRNPFFNIYYHVFGASDDPRFLHDHFYINCSIILEEEYKEHMVDGIHTRKEGDIVIRLPKTLHRIEIPEGKIVTSLFITGPRVRMWGFQIDKIERNWLGWKTKAGWMKRDDYLAKYGTNPNI